MSLTPPNYQFVRNTGALSNNQLNMILGALPFLVEVSEGHELPLEARLKGPNTAAPDLLVEYDAQLISLRPQKGYRLSDACFHGEKRECFSPSRVMDEATGGGACCSYYFNTRSLGLPFDQHLMLDIYKLG